MLPSNESPWVMLRTAVSAPFRRRGIGTRLFDAQVAMLPERMPECREISFSAYEPCPEVAGFADRHGFEKVRHFWLMERPTEGLRAPEWPLGIETRVFDGSPRALKDWNDVYNASFARHYHFVPSTVELCRVMAEAPGFIADGLLLAYDGAGCVGFCRDEVHATSGEVGSLGVVPSWQGRGLGRALLRWGSRWLLDHRALPLTLTVDGENETALGLYRSEGFEVVKTRPVWSRAIPR
jgi:mycothiol synthase